MSILKHFAVQTTKLQAVKVSLSDFFGSWAAIKMKMSQMGDDMLANELLVQMKSRENVLFNNHVLNAAVFLDPRYQQYMPTRKREDAIKYLTELQNKLNRIVRNSTSEIDGTRDAPELNENNTELAAFLANNYGDDSSFDDINTTESENIAASNDIKDILNNFIGEKDSLDTCVFRYWENNIESKPDLYKLASIIHSVPPTQTSVERAFSAMALILTPLRTRMSNDNLENVLLLRLNKEVFNEIYPTQ